MLIGLIALVFILAFILTNWRILKFRSILPPGPFPWPLLGNLLQLDPVKPYVTCQKWAKIYGPVFTMWLGHQPAVIIADFKVMKDALTKHGDQLASRPRIYAFDFFTRGNFGIVTSVGDVWKEQRRFSLQVLKNFGLGRNLMEEKILFEAKRLAASIRQDMGASNRVVLNVSTPIQLCIGSIISSILFGHTFEKGDSRFDLLMHTLDENFKLISSLQILLLNSFTWLRHVPLFGHFGMDEMRRHEVIITTFFTTELENHKQEVAENNNDEEEPKDFSAAYLKEMKLRKQKGEDMSYFSEWQLTRITADLWIAAMETTVSTLRWAILAMIKYPHAQQKVCDEIDAVLGRERLPTMADRESMPYVAATINEIQRWGNVVPINIYHSNDTDFQLGGYNIPERMIVIPQISVLAIDETIFPQPEQFRPDRFLEDDGKTLRKVEQFAPFSMGKRQCMGEGLARAELFLIFVHLMQKFRFSVAPGEKEPTAEPTFGFTSAPHDHECLVTLR